MKYYDYKEFTQDIKTLAQQIKPNKPHIIVGIARGGLFAAQALSYALDVRMVQSVQTTLYDNQSKRESIKIVENLTIKDETEILLVDDIVDSGETLYELLKYLQKRYPQVQFKTATLFYKKSAKIQVDYKVKEAKEWIDFFFESDFRTS